MGPADVKIIIAKCSAERRRGRKEFDALKLTDWRNADSISPVLVEAICCVVAADGKISRDEIQVMPDILRKSGFAISSSDVDKAARDFIKKTKLRGMQTILNECAANVYLEFVTPESQRALKHAVAVAANADSRLHRKEQLVIEKLVGNAA